MYNIRPAGPGDIPLIRDLTFRTWPQTYSALLPREQIDYMLDMMYSESSLQKQMDDGCRFLLIHDREVPVGFASYQEIKPALFKLHKLYILPGQQGKGTGRFLLDHITRELMAKKATALQLQVKRDNKARFFYEKLGFVVTEELDLNIGNGYFMNDYIMEKKLAD